MMQPIPYHGVLPRMSAISPALDISRLTHAITLRLQLLVALPKIGFGSHANCASNALHSDCGIIGPSTSDGDIGEIRRCPVFAGMSEAPLRGQWQAEAMLRYTPALHWTNIGNKHGGVLHR